MMTRIAAAHHTTARAARLAHLPELLLFVACVSMTTHTLPLAFHDRR
jgi:hypothetical protein